MIRFFEADCDNLNFNIFIFDKTFCETYISFIYIIYNLLKMFIYFFVIFRRFKEINL